MSASPGSGGGARGLVHLRAIIKDVGGTVLTEQITVPDAFNAFDEKGCLANPKLKSDLQQVIQAALR